jgi:AraC-like DNA-binding protein
MEDLLSEVVRSMKLQSSSYYRAELSGAYGLAVEQRPQHVRFHLALRGQMLVTVPSVPPTTVREGDVFLVTMGAPHSLMDRPGRPTVPLEEVKRRVGFRRGDILRWGEGPLGVVLLCGDFSTAIELFHPVFGSLPTLVHTPVAHDDELGILSDVLSLVDRETSRGAPGWMAIANRLSEIVMVQVLRAWVARQPEATGALQAMRDPRIKRALAAIHEQPETPWTVKSLAAVAGMSRTSFSTSFSELMGTTPMQYLTSWRMEVARSLLHSGAATLAEVAERVGYGSQASFTKVFRDAVGMTPGAYRETVSNLER